MYSHRIIAFTLFTSLFFISSSLFAGLTWFIFSQRSSTSSPGPDDLHDRTPSNRPTDEKDDESTRADLADEDTLTISNPPTPRLDFSRLSSTSTIARTYPPVVDVSARDDHHQTLKRSESVASESSRADYPRSTITHGTDESMSGDSHDDDTEIIEGHPETEGSFSDL